MSTQRIVVRSGAALVELVPNIVSAGAGDSGKVVALNSAGNVDATMMPPGVGANTQTVTAVGAITAGMLVNVYSNAGVISMRPADASTALYANGWAPASVAGAATGSVILGPSEITGLTGLTVGAAYVLGTAGAPTVTVPTTAGQIVQPVGFAVSTTSLNFAPGTPITIA